MVLETPNLRGWDRRMLPPRYWAGWHGPRHWALFDGDAFARLAKREGFEVVQIKLILSPYIMLNSLQYYVRDRIKLPRAAFFNVTNLLALMAASACDQIVIMFEGTTSNMQIVLRKPREETSTS